MNWKVKIYSMLNNDEENIPNTFAPNCRNNKFSINMIIHGLKFGFLDMKKMPPDVAQRVHTEINKRVELFETIMPRSVHSELVNQLYGLKRF